MGFQAVSIVVLTLHLTALHQFPWIMLFTAANMVRVPPVSELVRCILMQKSSFAYSYCIPSVPSSIAYHYYSGPLIFSAQLYFSRSFFSISLPLYFTLLPFSSSFLFSFGNLIWTTCLYLYTVVNTCEIHKRRETGKLGEGAKTPCILSIWHVPYCSEPSGHTTVTHFYPC